MLDNFYQLMFQVELIMRVYLLTSLVRIKVIAKKLIWNPYLKFKKNKNKKILSKKKKALGNFKI